MLNIDFTVIVKSMFNKMHCIYYRGLKTFYRFDKYVKV